MKRNLICTLTLSAMFAVSALALPGCASLLDPGTPPAVYTISPAMPDKNSGPKLNKQMAIVQPSANDMLATNRIITRYANGEVRAWKNVSWTSTGPAMIQRMLVQAFEADGRLVGMPYDAVGFNADCRMISDLRAFNVVLDENDRPSYVQVSLAVHLVDLRGGKSLGARASDCRAKVQGAGLAPVLVAFEQATGQCIQEVSAWAIQVLQSSEK